ncbi:hypothetical protein DBR06_SOUSAS2610008, partial [Sousa chinensis]
MNRCSQPFGAGWEGVGAAAIRETRSKLLQESTYAMIGAWTTAEGSWRNNLLIPFRSEVWQCLHLQKAKMLVCRGSRAVPERTWTGRSLRACGELGKESGRGWCSSSWTGSSFSHTQCCFKWN